MEEEFEIEELLHHGQEDMELLDQDFDALVGQAMEDVSAGMDAIDSPDQSFDAMVQDASQVYSQGQEQEMER